MRLDKVKANHITIMFKTLEGIADSVTSDILVQELSRTEYVTNESIIPAQLQ